MPMDNPIIFVFIPKFNITLLIIDMYSQNEKKIN